MTESYLALGIPAEAQKTAAILGYNFPESRWLHKTYTGKTKSWWKLW